MLKAKVQLTMQLTPNQKRTSVIILSLFRCYMLIHVTLFRRHVKVCIHVKTTSVTGVAYPSGAPEFTFGF